MKRVYHLFEELPMRFLSFSSIIIMEAFTVHNLSQTDVLYLQDVVPA
ncbi:MAG: hypothetical protein ACQEV7_16950 [Bacillota bacterium]